MFNDSFKKTENIYGGYSYYDEKGSKVVETEENIYGGYSYYDENGSKIADTEKDIFGNETFKKY